MEIHQYRNGYTMLLGVACKSVVSEEEPGSLSLDLRTVTCDECRDAVARLSGLTGRYQPEMRTYDTVPFHQLGDGRYDMAANNEVRRQVGLDPAFPDWEALKPALRDQQRRALARAERDLADAKQQLSQQEAKRGLLGQFAREREAKRIARLKFDGQLHFGPAQVTQYVDGFTLVSGTACELEFGCSVVGSEEEDPNVLARVFATSPADVTCTDCQRTKAMRSAPDALGDKPWRPEFYLVPRMAHRVVQDAGRYDIDANNARRRLVGLPEAYPDPSSVAQLYDEEFEIKLGYARNRVAHYQQKLEAMQRWFAEASQEAPGPLSHGCN